MKKSEWNDNLKIGDIVEVKEGIKCPDCADLDISGWRGDVFEITEDEEDNVLIGIHWDLKTSQNMPDNFVAQGDEEGLDNDLMYLFYEDVKYDLQETKLKMIENGLHYLIDLNLFDTFYDDIWSKNTPSLLEKYIEKNSYYDIPREETDEIKHHIVEWFGEDYGLAIIGNEFWMVSVGSVDEGGYKWWYKIKINTDKKDIAQKVILFDKCMPGKYCNIISNK